MGEAAEGGFYLYGITRAGGWRRPAGDGADTVVKIRYRDLEALVCPAPFSMPPLDPARVREHQRIVEASMRRTSVLPAPYGIVFGGRRAVLSFLEEQYLVLDEGLSFVHGHWELRLHLSLAHGEASPELHDFAAHVYSELRRLAHAALPLPQTEGRLFGAAFLVERDAWIAFVERADDIVGKHDEIVFDVTGPWPPYDFVRITI